MLTVEGVLALNNARMNAISKLFARVFQCESDVKIGNRREFDGCIFHRCVLISDSTGCNDHVAGHNVKVNTSASADSDKGVRAKLDKLLHSDRGRRTANTRGADRNLLAEKCTCVYIVLAVHSNVNGIVKILRDRLASTGIAGKQHVTANVALGAINMILFFCCLHNKTS